jgi:O-antigen biosynthesis protein
MPENPASESPHVVAFYLPQFHQVPENDAWHGDGFSEWTIVARSRPLFPGHRQPDLPGELGFYDLRVPETRYRQARLAREHGITGFLYYHYWFGGKRMLGRPFDEVLSSGQPDFPFALCWANESWYRRWQGTVDEMLVEQVYSEKDDLEHIRWLIECFKDPRYIRVHGRPLLCIYRPDQLPNATRTFELWRRECEAAGTEPPWLVMFETGGELQDPSEQGFDASAEFVPHRLHGLVEPSRRQLLRGHHEVYEYEDAASGYLDRPTVPWRRYPCVATAWDNSPRRQAGEAFMLANSTPDRYGQWLTQAASRQSKANGRDGVVFINAWNEWAEGAHLEPDTHWGRAYLEATSKALGGLFGERATSDVATESDGIGATRMDDLYNDLYQQFVALQQSSSGFLSYADRQLTSRKIYYEQLLQEERLDTARIANLNQTMFELLEHQAKRLEELGAADVQLPEWLSKR